MPLINLVIALIGVGVALYLINRYIPMASSIKTILDVVAQGAARTRETGEASRLPFVDPAGRRTRVV